MYSVFAAMATGWLKLAVCQPDALSLANVTVASCSSGGCEQGAGVGAGVAGGLVEADAR